MTLKVPTRHTEAFRATCDRLLEHVETAKAAPDTREARKALNEAWFALNDAQDRLNRGEEFARSDRRLDALSLRQ